MTGAAVDLHRGKVIRDLLLMLLRVSFASGQSILFVHPGDDAKRPLRAQLKLLHQVRRLHRDRDAGAIIDRARAQIPGIQMT